MLNNWRKEKFIPTREEPHHYTRAAALRKATRKSVPTLSNTFYFSFVEMAVVWVPCHNAVVVAGGMMSRESVFFSKLVFRHPVHLGSICAQQTRIRESIVVCFLCWLNKRGNIFSTHPLTKDVKETINGIFLLRCSHTWELTPASEHRTEFPQFLNLGPSVGLLGRLISSSQGL
jgi:hypothetical protein